MDMDTSRYIITTRPEIKFRTLKTKCIALLNIPLTSIKARDFNEKIGEEIVNTMPGVIVLTSSFGASEFFKNYYKFTKNPDFVAIGDKTAEVIKKYTGNVQVPTCKDSQGVLNLLLKYDNPVIALFRSNESNNIISNSLSQRNIKFHEYHIYDVIQLENTGLKSAFLSDRCIGILITSSMEARIFGENIGSYNGNRKIYSIGKITTDTLVSMGYKVSTTGASDFVAMIEKIDKENCSSGEWI
jgi:uroporphyrinogen-III synthase